MAKLTNNRPLNPTTPHEFPCFFGPKLIQLNPKKTPSAERQGGKLVNTPGQHIGIGTLHQVLRVKFGRWRRRGRVPVIFERSSWYI